MTSEITYIPKNNCKSACSFILKHIISLKLIYIRIRFYNEKVESVCSFLYIATYLIVLGMIQGVPKKSCFSNHMYILLISHPRVMN